MSAPPPIMGAPIMDIVVWLRSLGLGKYEAAFRENEIDETVLPSLTHETLKELGVTAVGHRLKLLDAIAALRDDTSAKRPSSDLTTARAAPSAPPRRPRRTPPSHGDVLRLGGLNGPLGSHGPRRPARGHFGLPEVRRGDRAIASAVS